MSFGALSGAFQTDLPIPLDRLTHILHAHSRNITYLVKSAVPTDRSRIHPMCSYTLIGTKTYGLFFSVLHGYRQKRESGILFLKKSIENQVASV